MQTRKYSRTMDEAFPFGPSYGSAIEKPRKTEQWLDYAAALVIGVLLAYGLMAYLV